ncbi:MAG: TauD/TfdA dioxygenase family protein [Rhodospirillales bacterium]|jgi:taurine dioxygenase
MSIPSIDVRKLTPTIGAEIFGVDIGHGVSKGQYDEIRQALLDNLVIFFRDQDMTLDQHKAFGRLFGKLHIHPEPAFPVAGHPEVITIKADENSMRVAGEVWHSDVSCDAEPPMGSILHIHNVPENGGGDTLFANMYAAYEGLSETMQSFVGGLSAMHDGNAAYRDKPAVPDPDKVYPRAEHPIVRTHPETGRKALFVNRYFTEGIVGLSVEESNALLEILYRHIEKPEWQCRFKWQPNSVAFWDNRCAQHNAIWDYFPQRRFGYRVALCGEKPV